MCACLSWCMWVNRQNILSMWKWKEVVLLCSGSKPGNVNRKKQMHSKSHCLWSCSEFVHRSPMHNSYVSSNMTRLQHCLGRYGSVGYCYGFPGPILILNSSTSAKNWMLFTVYQYSWMVIGTCLSWISMSICDCITLGCHDSVDV